MTRDTDRSFQAIVIGVSAGGMSILKKILPGLPADFSLPVIIVQHRDPHRSDDFLTHYLNGMSRLKVKEVDENEYIHPGVVYIAPANYHVLVEEDRRFSLSIDQPVNFARPSIDVLFESAAEVYQEQVIGLILTGANCDGSYGLKKIKQYGGLVLVQDPATAEAPEMPKAAMAATEVDKVLKPDEIAPFLCGLAEQ